MGPKNDMKRHETTKKAMAIPIVATFSHPPEFLENKIIRDASFDFKGYYAK
jgi:hypothetical protein